jgi:hypothetical protein
MTALAALGRGVVWLLFVPKEPPPRCRHCRRSYERRKREMFEGVCTDCYLLEAAIQLNERQREGRPR